MAPESKRTCLTLKQRGEVVDLHDKGLSARAIAAKIGCGKTQVANVIKKKESVKQDLAGNTPLGLKRKQPVTGYEQVNEMTHKWFLDATHRRLPVSGPLLQEKSRAIASALGKPEFKASNGWLESFIKSRGIVFKKMSGERGDVNIQCVEEWKERLPKLLEDFDECDVFNMDETGLQFKDTTRSTYISKNEDCAGGKLSKVRVTVALCCSWTGEKLKPLLIGKSKKPRCFKNLDTAKLPVTYMNNRKAWMNGELFGTWLKALNSDMARQKRKILLVLDNAPCHMDLTKELSNVKLLPLPPNTTSYTQPLDQGIIQAMKLKFRKLQLSHMISRMDTTSSSARQLLNEVNILHAITWVAEAWKQVEPSTIQKCFKRCGFQKEGVSEDIQGNDETNDADCSQEDSERCNFLADQLFGCTFQELVALDSDFLSSDPRTIDWDQPLEDVAEAIAVDDVVSDEAESDADIDDAVPPVSLREALKAIATAKQYALAEGNSELIDAALNLEVQAMQHAFTKKKNQVKITNYFHCKD